MGPFALTLVWGGNDEGDAEGYLPLEIGQDVELGELWNGWLVDLRWSGPSNACM
jgi:hypothetical protein